MGESKEKKRDKYCNLCMEEKLAISSYNNPKHQKGQKYLMFVDIRKVGYLVDKSQINFIFLYIYFMQILFFLVVFNQ